MLGSGWDVRGRSGAWVGGNRLYLLSIHLKTGVEVRVGVQFSAGVEMEFRRRLACL